MESVNGAEENTQWDVPLTSNSLRIRIHQRIMPLKPTRCTLDFSERSQRSLCQYSPAMLSEKPVLAALA